MNEALEQAAAPVIQPLTTAGWIFMICSLVFVVCLISWCFYRVLTAPNPEAEKDAIPPGFGP